MKTRLTSRFPACLLGVSSENQDINCETEHLVLGFIGVGFVVQSAGIGVTWSQLGGDLLALGAAGAWAWYGLAIGPLVGALGTVRATGWTMVIAALCCTPLVLVAPRGDAWRR